MDDIKALIIGILGGLIVLGIAKLYRGYRKKSLKDDIKFLEFEKSHITKMKRSSVEMNRSSFRALFAVLMFIGLANFIPAYLSLPLPSPVFAKAGGFLQVGLWLVVVALAFRFWKRYENLKNYTKFVENIDKKLEKLKSKYETT